MEECMKIKCSAVFLSFVTEENKSLREELFSKCFPTFEILKSRNTNLDLKMVSIDNASISSVIEKIKDSDVLDCSYLLDKNMFDTALFCAGLDASDHFNSDYILFSYDDFFIYNPDALYDTLQFMESSNSDCCRVTEYDVKDVGKFNSEITPKSVNPDSIRHSNSITGQKINHTYFGKFGKSEFYTTNWHYTSRPCVWRSSKLKEVMSNFSNLKVLQGFEGIMMQACQDAGVVFSTLDKGMMRTFPVNLSARTFSGFVKRVNESNHYILREEMERTLEKCRFLKKEER